MPFDVLQSARHHQFDELSALPVEDAEKLDLKKRFQAIGVLRDELVLRSYAVCGKFDTDVDPKLFPNEIAALLNIVRSIRYKDAFCAFREAKRDIFFSALSSDTQLLSELRQWSGLDSTQTHNISHRRMKLLRRVSQIDFAAARSASALPFKMGQLYGKKLKHCEAQLVGDLSDAFSEATAFVNTKDDMFRDPILSILMLLHENIHLMQLQTACIFQTSPVCLNGLAYDAMLNYMIEAFDAYVGGNIEEVYEAQFYEEAAFNEEEISEPLLRDVLALANIPEI